jgi:hypothetical protein
MAASNLATFTVGRDGQAVIVWNGNTLTLPNLTTIKVTPKFDDIMSKPLNTPPQKRQPPAGHDISVTFDRTDNSVEAIASLAETGYWAVGSAAGGTTNNGAMFLYINETNGSVTTRNYQMVSWALVDAGSFDADKAVKMELKGFASQMMVV